MKDSHDVIVVLDHTFDVVLESMAGSTGYSWCLQSMPKGVALISINNVPIRPGVAPVRQIFTFAALEKLKGGKLEFEMLCLFDLSRPVADTAMFNINIYANDENDVLEKELGKAKFLKGTGSVLHNKPIVAYGFPSIQLYGFPNASEISTINVIHSDNNCLLKYGTPMGVVDKEDDCTLKYGFPVSSQNYKYGFPLSNMEGDEYEVTQDDDNCLLKYGTPKGVAGKDDDCILKYGFPRKK